VVRQSEVLAHRKKWLFCKVNHVSIQTFVEGLLRLANVLDTTNGTLKNVNNICTLAINSTKYFVLFSGDLTSIRWRVLHMSTTFAAFVSTGVTLPYSCVRLRNFYPHQQVSQTAWLFEGNHGRLRKDFGQFGIYIYIFIIYLLIIKLKFYSVIKLWILFRMIRGIMYISPSLIRMAQAG
jgi:hypothetical protein